MLSNVDTIFTLDCQNFGLYSIGIRLVNKTESDTVIDKNGNIVDDLWVKITKVEIDDIDITDKIDTVSTYTDNHGNSVKTYGFLGFSTEYKLSLQVPGFYFLRNLSNINNVDFGSWYQSFAR